VRTTHICVVIGFRLAGEVRLCIVAVYQSFDLVFKVQDSQNPLGMLTRIVLN
jgi:hypothetical protein